MWTTIGHEWAIDFLQRAIDSERVAQTYLVTGPRHVGKTHLVKELAAALNCTSEHPPCGSCSACRRTLSNAHPDVTLIEPDNGRIKIDQVRQLQHELSLSPFEGRWRVSIVTDFETATREASNALLKTLEEPPARVVLALTARDASLLLPTIVSRCQVLPLRSVPPDTIAAALVARWQADPQVAQQLACIAAGRVGWAVSAAQDGELVTERDELLDDLVALLEQGEADRILYAERLSKKSGLGTVAHVWQTWWRDVMLVCAGCQYLIVNQDRMATLQQVALQTSLGAAQHAARGSMELLAQLQQNVNTRLALEVLLLGWPQLRSTRVAEAS